MKHCFINWWSVSKTNHADIRHRSHRSRQFLHLMEHNRGVVQKAWFIRRMRPLSHLKMRNSRLSRKSIFEHVHWIADPSRRSRTEKFLQNSFLNIKKVCKHSDDDSFWTFCFERGRPNIWANAFFLWGFSTALSKIRLAVMGKCVVPGVKLASLFRDVVRFWFAGFFWIGR